MSRLTAIAIALGLTTPMQAQSYSGNDLLQHCSADGGFSTGVCQGYIRAIADTFRPGCAPAGVTYGQVKDVVVKHLRENPQTRHREAVDLIGEAMSQAWPCPAPRR